MTSVDSARWLSVIAEEPVSAYVFGHVHEEFARAIGGATTYLKTASVLGRRWMIVELSAPRSDRNSDFEA